MAQPHEADALASPRSVPSKKQKGRRAFVPSSSQTRAQAILVRMLATESSNALGKRYGLTGRTVLMIAYGLSSPGVETLRRFIPDISPTDWFTFMAVGPDGRLLPLDGE